MSKQPLTITQLVPNSEPPTPDTSKRFKAQINPAEFTHSLEIRYNQRRTQGQNRNRMRFSAVEPDEISFSLVLDGTGAVGGDGPVVEVVTQLEQLCSIIYRYNSGAHEPNHVQVAWGTLIFNGRLRSLSTQYTLFKSSGAPLRAHCELSFVGFASNSQANLEANRSSPDLSHSVLVVEGDTLPLLCLRIYGDARYYPEVAAFNGLREFRRLPAGLRLHFPPLS